MRSCGDYMKAGDIVFVKGESLISKIVNYFDGEYSHVAIALSETHILEAKYFRDVVIRSMKYKDYKVVDLRLSDEQREVIVHKGINLVGRKYGYGQIIKEMLQKLFKFKDTNKLNNPNQMICSELVAHLLFQAGWISKKEIIKVSNYTPNELHRYLNYKIILNKEKGIIPFSL